MQYVCFPSEMNEMTEDHFLLGHGYGGPMQEPYCYDIVSTWQKFLNGDKFSTAILSDVLNNQAIFNVLSTCFFQLLGLLEML